MAAATFWDDLCIDSHFQSGRQRNLKNEIVYYNVLFTTDIDMDLIWVYEESNNPSVTFSKWPPKVLKKQAFAYKFFSVTKKRHDTSTQF